ncbi:hypothetical protein DRE_03886 [Drechslerella stenobrocha 248]|uniref:Uncharacterized protein n=1 Tax=Drechslerella stenobrocha 248 TaxID=1043628 RepID=W7HTU6_9PEZI|nr:hypothetical protein DRE_03886 [Drechslerella stenobrocha 248]
MLIQGIPVATLILALAPAVTAHGIGTKVVGNCDPKIFGVTLGYDAGVPRNGKGQQPFSRDIVVLKNPIVPPTKQSKWWKKPRTYWHNDCGANLITVESYYRKSEPQKFAKANNNQKNWWYYQMPAKPQWGQLIDWRKITTHQAKQNKIVKASPGGWIKVEMHQVNADGAGPYKAKFSENGEPNNWYKVKWTDPKTKKVSWKVFWSQPKQNVPGEAKKFSVRPVGALQKNLHVIFPIPAGLKCTGEYAGKKNICMLRYENFAKNGQFGGCIPFQLIKASSCGREEVVVKVEEAPKKPQKMIVVAEEDDDDEVPNAKGNDYGKKKTKKTKKTKTTKKEDENDTDDEDDDDDEDEDDDDDEDDDNDDSGNYF